MISIGTSRGIVLVFEDLDDIKSVVKLLSGQVEWIESEAIQPPYLYGVTDEAIPEEQFSGAMKEIKLAFTK